MLNQRKWATMVGALAISTMAAFPVMAQNKFITQEEIWSAPMMKMMDKNKDGFVSKEEYMSYMGAQYDMMDPKKAGKLDMKGFTDKKMMMNTFTRHDG